jgi:hypothetical protein
MVYHFRGLFTIIKNMGEYNTVVSTKISEEDYKLFQQAAQERYANGLMK